MEKFKFEQELKTAISFHRELKRARAGSEKSLYADQRYDQWTDNDAFIYLFISI